jgi:hypothetical protein
MFDLLRHYPEEGALYKVFVAVGVIIWLFAAVRVFPDRLPMER